MDEPNSISRCTRTLLQVNPGEFVDELRKSLEDVDPSSSQECRWTLVGILANFAVDVIDGSFVKDDEWMEGALVFGYLEQLLRSGLCSFMRDIIDHGKFFDQSQVRCSSDARSRLLTGAMDA